MYRDKGIQRAYMPLHKHKGMTTEEELKRVIKGCDKNGDGRLSKQELKEAFNALGSHFPAWRAWRALHYADSDGDGYISNDEYNSLVSYCIQRGYAFKQGSS